MSINNATSTQGKINLDLSYELHSDFISNMIKKGKAKVLAMIKCVKTNQRVMIDFTKPHRSLELQLADYAGKMTIVPYVVTVEKISGFRSEEHDDEIQKLRPEGMNLPIGAILAIGSQCEITLDLIKKIQAAISMVAKSEIKKGEYFIDTNQDTIQILMHPETLDDVRKLRHSAGPVLYASLYIPAVEHAIRALNDDNDEKSWAQALREALKDHDIEIDDDLKDKANQHAQCILVKSNLKPLGLMIDWNTRQRSGDDDESD